MPRNIIFRSSPIFFFLKHLCKERVFFSHNVFYFIRKKNTFHLCKFFIVYDVLKLCRVKLSSYLVNRSSLNDISSHLLKNINVKMKIYWKRKDLFVLTFCFLLYDMFESRLMQKVVNVPECIKQNLTAGFIVSRYNAHFIDSQEELTLASLQH